LPRLMENESTTDNVLSRMLQVRQEILRQKEQINVDSYLCSLSLEHAYHTYMNDKLQDMFQRKVELAPIPPTKITIMEQGSTPRVVSDVVTFTNIEKKPTNISSCSKKDKKWMVAFEELKAYKKVHEHCIVPRGYAINPRLASWVAEQRKQYKLKKDNKPNSITDERISMLDELNFAWNAQEAAWSRHMTDLASFREETGHCHVPLNHPKYPKLGLWVKEQRRHHTLMRQGKQSHMTEGRIKELERLGFCWDTHEATWLERIRELAEFRALYGHCNVPTNFPQNTKLGIWVHHQRRQHKKFSMGKKCHITKERIQALENLGFSWCPRDKNQANSDNFSLCSSDNEDRDLSELDLRPQKRCRTV